MVLAAIGRDYGVNTGPTDVVYYDFDKNEFVKELTVQEEAIVDYRVLDGKLVIPGVDSTESWNKGNLYVRGDGGWIKYRTVPYGVHVFDAVSWRDRWYVKPIAAILPGMPGVFLREDRIGDDRDCQIGVVQRRCIGLPRPCEPRSWPSSYR